MIANFTHTPVLLTETLNLLQPTPGKDFIDMTLGGGGHAEKVLELTSPDGRLLGFDADPAALSAAQQRLARFGQRLVALESYYDVLSERAPQLGFPRVDGILFDLGVSSHQLNTAQRGFSFQHDAPLDMRFGPSVNRTAAQVINDEPAAELERIFREYGEERYARRIARRIVESRPVSTTRQLALIVERAKPKGHREDIHPATRVFQALRIAVNEELRRLERTLPQTLDILAAGGRLVVISFHSLEDRLVKNFMRRESRDCVCPPGTPVCICGHTKQLEVLTRRPLTAGDVEVAANPRSRSAKLRAAERVAA